MRKDSGKTPFDLIPSDVEEQVAKVLAHGMRKYAARNWERGMPWSKAYGPLRRHLNKWAFGHRIDDESKLPHMAHVIVNAMFLLAYELRGMQNLDDVEPFLKIKIGDLNAKDQRKDRKNRTRTKLKNEPSRSIGRIHSKT